MRRITQGSTLGLADVEEFIGTLNRLEDHAVAEARELFDPLKELIVTRAPGRLDVMGGIADYSGSLVLQLPIKEAAMVALQRDSSRRIRIVSLGAEENQRAAAFEMVMQDFERDGSPIDYESARRFFSRDKETRWAAYIAGAFLVLMRELGVSFPEGARILIDSRVPEGKGVSSSAAIEVAAMRAIAEAFDIEIDPPHLALQCQKVENLVVGAPCGVMDQMTASCGEANRLISLLCQPAELRGAVDLPEEVRLWGIDSDERHSVAGADYGSVRVGAFIGYRIIAELAGLRVEPSGGSIQIEDPAWNGYLANLMPSEFEQRFARNLPEQIRGSDFLERYTAITDSVTRVLPDRRYAVLGPTRHPVYEHFRVRAYAELLGGEMTEGRKRLLGELMHQSHASYAACGLASRGTNLIVEIARARGQKIYGAKITGGGSGGTVAILADKDARDEVEEIARLYSRATGHSPRIFSGSSTGAAHFAPIRLSKI
jgi:L-arabinokinase